MTRTNLKTSSLVALVVAATLVVATVASYILLEPTVSRSQTTDTFLITQQITGELSFIGNVADLDMTGSIQGITGGRATATAEAVVRANNPQGYEMRLTFDNDPAMVGTSTGNVIADYTPATPGTPDFNFTASSSAEFAYTVAASPVADDVVGLFEDDGVGTCGSEAGGSFTAERCWYNPTNSATTIIDSSAPTNRSTTTITFVVNVPPNPVPALATDNYVATATLTLFEN